MVDHVIALELDAYYFYSFQQQILVAIGCYLCAVDVNAVTRLEFWSWIVERAIDEKRVSFWVVFAQYWARPDG